MLASALVMAASFAHTAPFTWDGGGNDDNWQTAGNWNPDGAPASDGTAALTFSGNTRPGPYNDFVAGTAFAGINFVNNGSGNMNKAFSLSGNRLTLGGNIATAVSSPALTDTIALDLTLSANQTVTANTDHHLTITGAINESGGSQGLTKIGWEILPLKALTPTQEKP